jgi:hypothetical protein
MSNPTSRESKRLAMRSQDKRLSALEAYYVETRVEQGLQRELKAALEILEERLTREEFVRVVRILAETGDERSRSRDSNTQA